jgi:hypothetical protein
MSSGTTPGTQNIQTSVPPSHSISGGAIGGIVASIAVVAVAAIFAVLVYKLKRPSVLLIGSDTEIFEMERPNPSNGRNINAPLTLKTDHVLGGRLRET